MPSSSGRYLPHSEITTDRKILFWNTLIEVFCAVNKLSEMDIFQAKGAFCDKSEHFWLQFRTASWIKHEYADIFNHLFVLLFLKVSGNIDKQTTGNIDSLILNLKDKYVELPAKLDTRYEKSYSIHSF